MYFETYNKTAVNVDALTHDPYNEFNEDIEQDYTAVDETTKHISLTQGEYETLCCYMGGIQFVEIAKFLSVQCFNVWRRGMAAIQKKHLELQYN